MIGWSGFLASVNTIGMRVVSAATTNGPRSSAEMLDVGLGGLLFPILVGLVGHARNPAANYLAVNCQRANVQSNLYRAEPGSCRRRNAAPPPRPAPGRATAAARRRAALASASRARRPACCRAAAWPRPSGARYSRAAPARSGKPPSAKVTTAPLRADVELGDASPARQFSLISTIFSRFAVSSGSAPKRSISSAAKASIAWRSSSSPRRR